MNRVRSMPWITYSEDGVAHCSRCNTKSMPELGASYTEIRLFADRFKTRHERCKPGAVKP